MGKSVSRHLQHRFVKDFSYGRHSLDGLLFPQRAFFCALHSQPQSPSRHNSPRLSPSSNIISTLSLLLSLLFFLLDFSSSKYFFQCFFSIFAAHLQGLGPKPCKCTVTGAIAQLVRAQDS